MRMTSFSIVWTLSAVIGGIHAAPARHHAWRQSLVTRRSALYGRDDQPMTIYNWPVYDELAQGASNNNALPPLADVFMSMAAMHQQSTGVGPTITATPDLVSSSLPSPNTLPSIIETPTAIVSHGPGLVIITTRPQPLNPKYPTSTPDKAIASTPMHKLSILGGIILGLVLLTMCLFFILNPRIWGSCCGPRTAVGIMDKTHSWMRSSVRGDNDKEKAVDAGSIERNIKETDSARCPRSKFSITSSDYINSRRNSSSSASTFLSVSSSPVSLHTQGPTRPPRPPTSDSPILSDSVYFAQQQAEQPYCMTTSITSDSEQRADTRKSEPLSCIISLEEGSPTYYSPLLSPMAVFMGSLEEPTGHTRTHSEPLFSRSLGNLQKDTSKVSRVSISKLIHRRSRSLSGWAYPTKDKRVGLGLQ